MCAIRVQYICIVGLYALYPDCTHDQRVTIETTTKLCTVLDEIDGNSDNLEIMYVYPEDCSPTSSPAREVNKSETSSAKSNRSTYQKRFKQDLDVRDKLKCLLCNSVDALIGCHIVDAAATLSIEETTTLDMLNARDRYAVYNGLLLCSNCHSMYDNWQLGVNDDGYLVKWVKNIGWVTDTTVNV